VPFIDIDALPVKEPRPGWAGRFFHSEHLTFVRYEVAAGSDLHAHHHENEEVWLVVDGELEVTVGGETRTLTAGHVAVVPPGTDHAASSPKGCTALVVDYPRRETVGGFSTE
jgi:mannose-6-phosphate isomerase-like protein (cupin superfamily)